MSIRQKILVYFSTTVVLLTAISLLFIYKQFSEFREEEFQQRQKEKITSTLKYLTEIQRFDAELMESLDKATIQGFFDEKLLIFNQNKKLIYSSIDDTPISNAETILNRLSEKNNWIETKDGLYDIVGIYFNTRDGHFYGISKAYDTFGYSKLNYLRNVILLTFILITLSVIILSNYLANRIARPISDLANQIANFDFERTNKRISVQSPGYEIQTLTLRFNQLMERMQEAYAFQKHAIHHISHELKTPIAVLVSNFERMEREQDVQKLQKLIALQKEDTKSLSEIINALLELSKAESGVNNVQETVRIDELIFDLVDELNTLYPEFLFSINFKNITNDEQLLSINGNMRLLRSAFTNLMHNCVLYSNDSKAQISIITEPYWLTIILENNGNTIAPEEQQYLFRHFFRGENSLGTKGFGLGLVFIHKIITLHKGTVAYKSGHNKNIFTVRLPIIQAQP
jgi:signal transduction histidine kinase